ncbi:MAG: DUF2442 domain-containing protein [Chitinispirillales bacterium]|jgi:hypothetical protein|nr:DUF2442 domain-containing protein [Chitinispirillales bacterium]
MLQPKIAEVSPLSDYKLLLIYETNERKFFDVAPYISGDWFGKLHDSEYFNTVRVSGNTVEWKGGQDIAPHELYEYSVAQQK